MKTTTANKILWVSISILSLVIGGIIYLFFRSRTLYMFYYIPNDIITWIDRTTPSFIDIKNLEFVIYNLPAGLWTISYLILMQLIIPDARGINRMIWIYSLPFILRFVEFLQLLNFVPGTFDFMDIIVYIIPIIFSILIDIRYEKF